MYGLVECMKRVDAAYTTSIWGTPNIVNMLKAIIQRLDLQIHITYMERNILMIGPQKH